MFDLNFYNQIFDCLRSKNELNKLSSIILSINSHCQVKNNSKIVDNSKSRFDNYIDNGIFDYTIEYVHYFLY